MTVLLEQRLPRALWWILAAGFTLRFFHSDAPLLGTNSWRQCDNAMIARNFARRDMNPLRPRVDWAGPDDGIVQMEFPAYQWGVAVLYRLLGVRDWIGRWVSIMMSVASIGTLFLLARRMADARTALWGSFFFAILPLNVYYGRAFMVEASMLFGLIAGVYAFDRWLESDAWRWWAAAIALLALAALLKIISLWVGLPLLWLAWRRDGWRCLRRPALWGVAVGILAPVGLWYGWSGRLLSASGLSLMGDWRYGTDKWGDWHLAGSLEFWNRIVFQRVAEKHLTWAGFAAAAAGFLLRRHHRDRLWDAWLAGVIVATAIAAPGSYHHEHYQIPFVVPGAMLMGRVFARGFRKRFWLSPTAAALAPVLLGIALLSGWRYLQMCALESRDDSRSWRLAALIRAHTRPDDLVITVDGNDPTALYHSARRGWVAHADALMTGRDAFLDPLVGRGAGYLAALHDDFAAEDRTVFLRRLLFRYPVAQDDGAGFLLRLRPELRAPGQPGRNR